MADAGVIREFLVAFRYVLDASSQARFDAALKRADAGVADLNRQIEGATRSTTEFGKAMGGIAGQPARQHQEATAKFAANFLKLRGSLIELGKLSIGVGASFAAAMFAVGKQYERLYYVAQRTNDSVADLNSLATAFRMVGAGGDEAAQAISHMTSVFRAEPGREGQLLGIAAPYLAQVKKDLGDVSDTTVEYFSVVRAMANMAPALADRFGQIFFGWSDAETQRHIRNIDKEQAAFKQAGETYNELGLSQQRQQEIAQQGVELTNDWNRTLAILGGLWSQTFGDAEPLLHRIIQGLNEGLLAIGRWNANWHELRRLFSDLSTAFQQMFSVLTGSLGILYTAYVKPLVDLIDRAISLVPGRIPTGPAPTGPAGPPRPSGEYFAPYGGTPNAAPIPPKMQGGGVIPAYLHPGEVVVPQPLSRSFERAFEMVGDWLMGSGRVPKVELAGDPLRQGGDEGGGSVFHWLGEQIGHGAKAVFGALEPFTGKIGQGVTEAVKFFMGRGWSRAQSVGIAANIQAESSFNPQARGDFGAAFGLGQWHGDRQANFQRLFGHPIQNSTFQEQMRFYDWELKNTEKEAGDRLRQAQDSAEAAGIVSRYHERPGDVAGQMQYRGGIARQFDKAIGPLDDTKIGGGATVKEGDRNVTMNVTHNVNVAGGVTPGDTADRYHRAARRLYADTLRDLRGGALA